MSNQSEKLASAERTIEQEQAIAVRAQQELEKATRNLQLLLDAWGMAMVTQSEHYLRIDMMQHLRDVVAHVKESTR